jgi:hypothetical protein
MMFNLLHLVLLHHDLWWCCCRQRWGLQGHQVCGLPQGAQLLAWQLKQQQRSIPAAAAGVVVLAAVHEALPDKHRLGSVNPTVHFIATAVAGAAVSRYFSAAGNTMACSSCKQHTTALMLWVLPMTHHSTQQPAPVSTTPDDISYMHSSP